MPETEIHFEPPRGMRDFYPEDMTARNAVFGAWTRAALGFGFDQYDSCVVESLELLKRKSGEEITDQIYTFKDKSDRDLALRPEMTPTLARMIAARQGQLSFPLKWFTIAQCFRYERTTRGRKREHYQWNLDIVGEESLGAEAEILACALSALAALGLGEKEIQVRYNNRALLADLFAKAGIRDECHQPTFLALDKRGKIPDAEIVILLKQAGLDEWAVDAVLKIMAINTLAEARSFIGADTPALATAAELPRRMADYGLENRLCFDMGVVRGLGYYTGIVFEAYALEHKMRALFGGGRYDRLLSDLGGNRMTAVGLGFGDVVITDLLGETGKIQSLAGADKVDLAIGFMEEAQRPAAVRIAQAWRSSGKRVDLGLCAEKAKRFFGRVGKGGVMEAVFLGPDDITSGNVRVKNLRDRAERQLSLNDLCATSH
jgi:histidyl-tRNA synthetase